MYKLLVSDFDGTLLDRDDGIPLTTVAAIDNFRRHDGKFCVASGRVLDSVLSYNKDYFFIDYIVALNGAYIYDVSKNKIIYKKKLTQKIINTIKKMYTGKNIMYFCTAAKWHLYLTVKDSDYYLEDEEEMIIDFKSFLEKNKNDIYKIEIYFKSKEKALKEKEKIDKLGLNIKCNLQLHTKLNYLLEITSDVVNKYEGVNIVKNILKIKDEEVAVIGDSYNDKELIESKFYSGVVSNAPKDLQKLANYVAPTNNEKGVEKFIGHIS